MGWGSLWVENQRFSTVAFDISGALQGELISLITNMFNYCIASVAKYLYSSYLEGDNAAKRKMQQPQQYTGALLTFLDLP